MRRTDDFEAVLLSGVEGETYHVGSGREASITEVADAVLAATGRPLTMKTIIPDRPGHDRRYLLDSTKIRRELGWAPTIDFDGKCLSCPCVKLDVLCANSGSADLAWINSGNDCAGITH